MAMVASYSAIDSNDEDINHPNSGKKSSLSVWLERIPLGWYHNRLLLICGLGNMADGMEVSLLGFLGACVGENWNLSTAEVASIMSVVFAGELFGGLIWGPLGDKFGRRPISIIALAVVSAFGILTSLAPNLPILLVFQFFVGIGVGGMAVTFDLLAEMLPTSHRGSYLIYLQGFWTIGSAFVTIFAWMLLSNHGWRALALVTVVPVSISLICSIVYLPESPRWLLVHGRTSEAEEVVRQMAAVNKMHIDEVSLQAADAGSVAHQQSTTAVSEILGTLSDLMVFVSPAYIKLTLPLWTVWFTFGFGYYGVVLLVVKLFQKKSELNTGEICDFDYGNILLNSSSEVVAVVMLFILIDKWGRVSTMSFMFCIAGISAFFFGFELNYTALMIVSVCARISSMGTNLSTWVATCELFPTEMRASGHALATAMERLGSLLSPFLIHSRIGLSAIGITLAVINGIGMGCTLCLPETKGVDLDTILLADPADDSNSDMLNCTPQSCLHSGKYSEEDNDEL
mmetsp:Transcript_16084/g.24243  ORF Transcript_16084/g.24243 Transcript_16084/m.24243 type:complete len:513 (+) Transcript_16084:51-1589(+)